jgi:hypothetical protein
MIRIVLAGENIFLSIILILVFFKILMLMYTPIYPDEINWRFEYTRYFLDNGIYYYFIKPCSTDGLIIPFYASMQMMVLSITTM